MLKSQYICGMQRKKTDICVQNPDFVAKYTEFTWSREHNNYI